MRDVTASSDALDTRSAPVVLLTLSPDGPATSSSAAVPRGGRLTIVAAFGTPPDVAPAVKYSSSAEADEEHDGLKTRTSVANVWPMEFVTRPATATSYSFTGASAPRISPPGNAEEWTLT